MFSQMSICEAHGKEMFRVLVHDLSANCILEVHSEFRRLWHCYTCWYDDHVNMKLAGSVDQNGDKGSIFTIRIQSASTGKRNEKSQE